MSLLFWPSMHESTRNQFGWFLWDVSQFHSSTHPATTKSIHHNNNNTKISFYAECSARIKIKKHNNNGVKHISDSIRCPALWSPRLDQNKENRSTWGNVDGRMRI